MSIGSNHGALLNNRPRPPAAGCLAKFANLKADHEVTWPRSWRNPAEKRPIVDHIFEQLALAQLRPVIGLREGAARAKPKWWPRPKRKPNRESKAQKPTRRGFRNREPSRLVNLYSFHLRCRRHSRRQASLRRYRPAPSLQGA